MVRAQQLWFSILEAQIETGNPYMLYKDAANSKSNQQNLGTIKCSNLCTEIIEYTSPEETAVCNLASIALPRFVREKGAQPGWESKKLVGSLDADERSGSGRGGRGRGAFIAVERSGGRGGGGSRCCR